MKKYEIKIPNFRDGQTAEAMASVNFTDVRVSRMQTRAGQKLVVGITLTILTAFANEADILTLRDSLATLSGSVVKATKVDITVL